VDVDVDEDDDGAEQKVWSRAKAKVSCG